MAKVTSKLQVTIPKLLADQLGIAPGDEIHFERSGNGLRATIGLPANRAVDVAERLKLFDQATARQRTRQRGSTPRAGNRGWKRDDLYTRGRSR